MGTATRMNKARGKHGWIRRFGYASSAAWLLWASGCGGSPSAVNNDLRAEVLQLEQQVAQLEEALERRERELQAMREAQEPLPEVEGAPRPRLAELRLGEASGPYDSDGDLGDDVVRVYLQTFDQQGRRIPVAGRATVRAVWLPDGDAGDGSGGEPLEVASRAYEPAEFDRTYRAGFSGTHYTLELPLPEALPAGMTEATVIVTLIEGQTGARHRVQEAFPVVAGERSGGE